MYDLKYLGTICQCRVPFFLCFSCFVRAAPPQMTKYVSFRSDEHIFVTENYHKNGKIMFIENMRYPHSSDSSNIYIFAYKYIFIHMYIHICNRLAAMSRQIDGRVEKPLLSVADWRQHILTS